MQINFRFDMTRSEYEQVMTSDASIIAATPGLCRKVWLMNEAQGEAGGIYLFDSASSLQAFLDPVMARLESTPGLREISAMQFMGCTEVYPLEDGAQAWKAMGLPIEPFVSSALAE